MRILLPHDSQKFHGGGSTFVQNFHRSIEKYGHQVVENGSPYDVLFIAGATLVEREQVIQAKKDGKCIILRVDNLLEDRKNRSTGMSRLKEYATLSDVIVYQSEWAKRLLSPLIGNGIVIYNGVDTEVFTPRKKQKDWDGLRIFYSKYSRNEVKHFHEVQYFARELKISGVENTMILVGRYADDYLKIEHPFDFHHGEEYEYHGVISDQKKLAEIIQGCDMAFLPYYADACSNTIMEVQACGVPVLFCGYGGSKEIVQYGTRIDHSYSYKEMVERTLLEKVDRERYRDTFSLETMGEKYHALIQTVGMAFHEV